MKLNGEDTDNQASTDNAIADSGSERQAVIWQAEQKLYGDRYTIIKAQQDRTELGSGGFGITYLARDDRGREVVIKTLNEKAQTSPKFAKIQQDFRDEATRLGYCKHPHIVQIENKFDVGQLPCIVLEYIKGETLWERVANHGALSEAEALLYVRQIGEALIVVHGKGLLHRDVNPSNIIVRADRSEAVLIDFGISKEYIPDLTQQYTVEYTPFFAPLEQHDENGKHGKYTDVYALAATMFYLVTGNRPTPAANRVINDEFIPQNIDNTKISDKVKNAILNGMELDPKRRSQSVDKWLMLLEGSNKKNFLVWNLKIISNPDNLRAIKTALIGWISAIATMLGLLIFIYVSAIQRETPNAPQTSTNTGIEGILRPVVKIVSKNKLGIKIGAGIVIKRKDNQTLILTSGNVIYDKQPNQISKDIQVEFFSQPPEGKVRLRHKAKLLTMTSPDDLIDLAVIEVIGDVPEDIQPLPIADTSISRGIRIIAIGHPADGISWTVEHGEISSYDNQQIQISGINFSPGYSGGAIINSQNQLLGILITANSNSNKGFAYNINTIIEKMQTLGISIN